MTLLFRIYRPHDWCETLHDRICRRCGQVEIAETDPAIHGWRKVSSGNGRCGWFPRKDK